MKNKGQNFIEYSLILGIVLVALFAMQAYFKRGIQSVIRIVANDYGPQGEPIGDIELAIKKKVYEEEKKTLTKSSSTGSWTQTISNLGGGSISSQISGSNQLTANSLWIGADYRTRRQQELKGKPSVSSGVSLGVGGADSGVSSSKAKPN